MLICFLNRLKKRPYLGRNRKEIRDQILAKQVQIKKNEIPEDWSMEAADFVNRLIQRKPNNRLGLNGPEEVKEHPWLKDFPWNKLLNREVEPPFLPSVINVYLICVHEFNSKTKTILIIRHKTLKVAKIQIILRLCNRMQYF